ncbi:MAG: hypothetical protein JSR37_02495 [Verrucomicrobia bacterium]|nr:hypothetical protein [Verrucomicrobiota bacterium]MBS0636649.1 hypothetical protein [Verrucomicrobiota bacterium]
MKVTANDIPAIVQTACTDLRDLKALLDASNIDEEQIKTVIVRLQKEANELTRAISKSPNLAPLDPKLETDLRTSLDSIKKVSSMLGHQQALFLGVFNRIENCIKKFESKVTKVENDPLR